MSEVIGDYSNEERGQIEKFGDDAYYVMLARVSGKRISRRVINNMLENYSEMSPGVRDAVKGKMKNSLFYFGKSVGGLAEFYLERARDLDLDVNRF